MPDKITLTPIGHCYCRQNYPYEMPRQGALNQYSDEAYIELTLQNAALCLSEINGFSHIWVIYSFHQNKGWKPLVPPPSLRSQKVGVFASRSPYRPNSIGMSLVKFERMQKNRIYISEYDLLNNTPILDIKPYIKYSDFPAPPHQQGWVDSDQFTPSPNYKILYSDNASEKLTWLNHNKVLSFNSFLFAQLSLFPKDQTRKRIKSINDTELEISYRTWRIKFQVDEEQKQVFIQDIYSGYSPKELSDLTTDPYKDKSQHSLFNCVFLVTPKGL